VSYADLSRKLKQRFGSENHCEVYKLELRNRRRGPRESLSDLMQDVRRLMVLAYSAQTSEMWESVAINVFFEAVDDPELALEVRKRGHTTLDEAYRDALLLEGFVKTCMKTDHAKGRGQIGATSDKNLDLSRDVKELRGLLKRQESSHRQQLEKQEKRIQQIQQQSQNTLTDHARNTNNGRNSASNVRQPSGYWRGQVICYVCSQLGHIQRNCPYQNHQIGLHPTTAAVGYQNAGGRGRNTSSSNTGQTNPVPSSRLISGSKSAYLPAMIFGRKRWCLLDTGSEVSVIPARYVPSKVITPFVRNLNAANGSSIPVTEETNLLLDLGISLCAYLA